LIDKQFPTERNFTCSAARILRIVYGFELLDLVLRIIR
jgi:hypothetical protein